MPCLFGQPTFAQVLAAPYKFGLRDAYPEQIANLSCNVNSAEAKTKSVPQKNRLAKLVV
jgi:hypothetical protein